MRHSFPAVQTRHAELNGLVSTAENLARGNRAQTRISPTRFLCFLVCTKRRVNELPLRGHPSDIFGPFCDGVVIPLRANHLKNKMSGQRSSNPPFSHFLRPDIVGEPLFWDTRPYTCKWEHFMCQNTACECVGYHAARVTNGFLRVAKMRSQPRA